MRLMMKGNSKKTETAQGKGKTAGVEQKQCCAREEEIRKKAYELYEKRGCQPGQEWEDWLEAERTVCK